jgi:DNA-directed RNA polymerase specialized sigma24 family protein
VVVVVDDHDAATEEFLRHRGLLFSIAYNILGSVADTEDVIQETWMGWASRRRGGSAVENPRAYPTCSARPMSWETYVGEWIPSRCPNR